MIAATSISGIRMTGALSGAIWSVGGWGHGKKPARALDLSISKIYLYAS
jgi:hypothetical protein